MWCDGTRELEHCGALAGKHRDKSGDETAPLGPTDLLLATVETWTRELLQQTGTSRQKRLPWREGKHEDTTKTAFLLVLVAV